MKNLPKISPLVVFIFLVVVLLPFSAFGDDGSTSLLDAFKQGTLKGQVKTYFFTQTFDGEGLNDSEIWVNGGNLGYKTAGFYGFNLGATFQASYVGHKDDEDGKTTGSMDVDGAVLSEINLGYNIANTDIKIGRQYMSTPLVAGSGSRMIKESFESYIIGNKDIPGTHISAGWVTKYQTRSDQSNYGDNWFVDYDTNGTGRPGDFYDIGDDGMLFVYAKNTSVKDLAIQAQYGNVLDEVASFYADAKYTIDVQFKPFVAAQYYYTDYDDATQESNYLYGVKGGATFYDFNVFAAFTSAGGDTGEDRVFRGVGQGSYYVFTTTTKTSGVQAYNAGTDAYQIGAQYKTESLMAKLFYTNFDDPAPNLDLDEYTLNFIYNFGGWAKGLSASVDFSILDYENDQKDATDLRTRLTYSF